jgi:hypothetical protein
MSVRAVALSRSVCQQFYAPFSLPRELEGATHCLSLPAAVITPWSHAAVLGVVNAHRSTRAVSARPWRIDDALAQR